MKKQKQINKTGIEVQAKRKVLVTDIFEKNLNATGKIIVNIGGARSSKSYSIIQLFIQKFINEKNKAFLITRKTLPSLKLTAYKVFVDLLKDYKYYYLCEHNKSDRTITLGSNFINFLSIDDPDKIKSTEYNYIFMEEANEFTYDDFITLELRLSAPTLPSEPNKMYLALNPTDEQGWINQILRYKKGVEIIHSTYKDNPFLQKEYIGMLENLKNEDPEYWKIYGLGEYGKLGNLIYVNNYEIISNYPDRFEEVIYGLDFGYNNPTALLEIGVKDKMFYLTERLYETGLTNADLIERLRTIIKDKRYPIYADASEPARIEEIFNQGFNILPADKSVKDGIDYCKSIKFYSNPENINFNKEIKLYKYRTDKAGNTIDEPLKFNDHLMDCMRYAIYTHFKGQKFSKLEFIKAISNIATVNNNDSEFTASNVGVIR